MAELSNKDVIERNKGIVKHWEKIWFFNARRNVKYIDRLVSNNDGNYLHGIPVCKTTHECHIVGSGPSLDDSIKELKKELENPEKTHYVIAGTSNADVCIKEGIIPDFIMCLDPQIEVAEHIRRYIDVLNSNTIVVLNPTLHPEVFKILMENGKRVALAQVLVQSEDLSYDNTVATALRSMFPEIKALMPASGSTMGQQIALMLFLKKCKDVDIRRVSLWGCDLAYVDGKRHCTNYQINHSGVVRTIHHPLVEDTENNTRVGEYLTSLNMQYYARSCMVLLKEGEKLGIEINNRSKGLLDGEHDAK